MASMRLETARRGNHTENTNPNVSKALLLLFVICSMARFRKATTSSGRKRVICPSNVNVGRCRSPSRDVTKIKNGNMANKR